MARRIKRLSAVLASTLILVSCGHTHTIHIPPGVVSEDKKTVRGYIINDPWLLPKEVDACSKAWLIPKSINSKPIDSNYHELMKDLFGNNIVEGEQTTYYTGILHTAPLFSIRDEFTDDCDSPTGEFSFRDIHIQNGEYYVVVQGFWSAYMKIIKVPREEDIDFEGKFPLFSNYFVNLVLVALGGAATAYLTDITD